MAAPSANVCSASESEAFLDFSVDIGGCCNALQSLNLEKEEERTKDSAISAFSSSGLDTERESDKKESAFTGEGYMAFNEAWVCAICHDKIKLEETAQIKGCEHAYCVTCILRWASYKAEPWCPQCRLPFSFLYVYRGLEGSLNDYLVEESVCLLLRASWFKPLPVHEFEEHDDFQEEYDAYEEYYYTSPVRLGNRRWGDSGYVRAGRREARPVGVRQLSAAYGSEASGSSSRQPKGKEPAKEKTGRRAKRAQKREAEDQMTAVKQKHQQSLHKKEKHASSIYVSESVEC